jgi:hypothetical protein
MEQTQLLLGALQLAAAAGVVVVALLDQAALEGVFWAQGLLGRAMLVAQARRFTKTKFFGMALAVAVALVALAAVELQQFPTQHP